MKRTVSSDRPLGALSDSMSVSNPYLYWSTSIRRTCSTVSCTAGILPSAHGFKDRGLDLSVMVVFSSALVHPLKGRLRRPCLVDSYVMIQRAYSKLLGIVADRIPRW